MLSQHTIFCLPAHFQHKIGISQMCTFRLVSNTHQYLYTSIHNSKVFVATILNLKSSELSSRARMGRQQLDISNDVAQIENRCNECTILDIESGVVCATDGKNYQNMCQLKQTSCKLLRRQGEWDFKLLRLLRIKTKK